MAGSSNFVQFNPGQNNQEGDSSFASDALVTGGVPVDATLPSPFLNKLWYQLTTFATAFNGALANKGYKPSDANLATLQAIYSNILTQADVLPSLTSVTYAPTLTFSGAVSNGWDVTLFGNITSLSLTNLRIFQEYTIALAQDSVGGRIVAWPASLSTGLSSPPQPDSTANSVSIFKFLVRADGSLHISSSQIVS